MLSLEPFSFSDFNLIWNLVISFGTIKACVQQLKLLP